jgi:hypothetical protein
MRRFEKRLRNWSAGCIGMIRSFWRCPTAPQENLSSALATDYVIYWRDSCAKWRPGSNFPATWTRSGDPSAEPRGAVTLSSFVAPC